MTKLRQHLTSDVQGTYTSTSAHGPEDLTRREERPAPWMPLDGLAQEWAAFGQETLSAEGSLAISHAFLALSAEQQALREYECREEPSYALSRDPWLGRCSGYERCLVCLQEAATQWEDVARVLTEVSLTCRSDRRSQVTPIGHEELRQGLLSALHQRLRVTTISLSLLTEQVKSEASSPRCAPFSASTEVPPWN